MNNIKLTAKVFDLLEKCRQELNKNGHTFYYGLRLNNNGAKLTSGYIFADNYDHDIYIPLANRSVDFDISIQIKNNQPENENTLITELWFSYNNTKVDQTIQDNINALIEELKRNNILEEGKPNIKGTKYTYYMFNFTKQINEIEASALNKIIEVIFDKIDVNDLYQQTDFAKATNNLLPSNYDCIQRDATDNNYFKANLGKKDPDKLVDTLAEQLKLNKNIILSGAPGTGKTHLANDIAKKLVGNNHNERIGFVQFHPSYDYTDFVEGLRPTKSDTPGQIAFEKKNGIFKQFCERALREDKKTNFVFIIDEINRGEISKIFGELFFSVDPGYRGKVGKVRTQYANMQTEPNEFDRKLDIAEKEENMGLYGHFFVPENVYIIGTMNDIDRSVESLDFAFRRRFPTREITYSDTFDAMLKDVDKTVVQKAKVRLDSLNDAITEDEYELSSSYCIGGSYFRYFKNLNPSKLKDENYITEAFNELWDKYLTNILKEYFNGSPKSVVDGYLEKLKKAYNLENDDNEE